MADRPSTGRALAMAFAPAVMRRSLMVAMVVGLVLNAINQGDRVLGGQPLDWVKIVLTFVVPFFVATYGAYSAFRARATRR